MRSSLVLLLLCVSSTASAVDFYVAPTGDDTNPGSKQRPFATLTRARDAVRVLKSKGPLSKPVHVNVAGGAYTLTEPLVLLPEDKGTEQAPVIYQAVPGAQQVLLLHPGCASGNARSRFATPAEACVSDRADAAGGFSGPRQPEHAGTAQLTH